MSRAHGRHGAHHGTHLSRRQRRATYVIVALAWTSGALWLLFHYFLQQAGEFGPAPHPLEQWWLRLHGACAFLLLWIAGLVWAVHARGALRWPRRRPSGIAIIGAFCLLAASGYLIYYADEGLFRDTVEVVHWVVGLALAVPVLTHAWPLRRNTDERRSSVG